MSLRIATMTPANWPRVRSIYEEGVATGLGTFETTAPSWEEWDAAPSHILAWLRARKRSSAGRSEADIETSLLCRCGRSRIHVVALARGRGVGRALLEALIASAEAHGIWTLQ